VKQHEPDKVRMETNDETDEFEVQRVEFWSKKKAGFVLTKTWQDDRKAIMHIHKRVVLVIFKRMVDQMRKTAKENNSIIQYFQGLVDQER